MSGSRGSQPLRNRANQSAASVSTDVRATFRDRRPCGCNTRSARDNWAAFAETTASKTDRTVLRWRRRFIPTG